VKANAYGHGINAFVPLAEQCGVRHFAVATSFEAEEVVEARTLDSDIMIMGILYPEDLPWVIDHEIEYFVFNFHRLERSLEEAREVGKRAHIHLELETGGNRTGLHEEQLDKALKYLEKHKDYLELAGVCTHFAGIESMANQFRVQEQKKNFNRMCRLVEESEIEPRFYHTACSAAALAFPDTVMDMVRVGTSQFGMWPSPDIYNIHLMEEQKMSDTPLQQVLTWKTDIMHLNQIDKGDYIGYGTAFQAPRDMQVAVLPLGYSNGYARSLSNHHDVLIRGHRAPIVGLINMNVFMVDVSDIPGVQLRDEVVLIGHQKNESITVKSFTESLDAINNEFVSRLPAAIPRITVD
jgi:alanine racemase